MINEQKEFSVEIFYYVIIILINLLYSIFSFIVNHNVEIFEKENHENSWK